METSAFELCFNYIRLHRLLLVLLLFKAVFLEMLLARLLCFTFVAFNELIAHLRPDCFFTSLETVIANKKCIRLKSVTLTSYSLGADTS